MVTSFYIMKMSNNKRGIDLEKYYENLLNKNKLAPTQKCRICLTAGSISITASDNAVDLNEALHMFVNIDITEKDSDVYPKYLCKICFQFIKDAIIFRKIAKRTDEILKQSVKDETIEDNIEYSHDYEDSSFKEPSQEWSKHEEVNCIEVNVSKEEVIKVSAKIQCTVCNKIINKSYHKEHMTMHDPDHYKYICDVCGKSFRLRCAYHNHSLRHRKDFPFKCQFCPYKARYAELLKTHLRTHTGDYRYMCTECPARFLFRSNLNSHMFKHREPQHKCDTCKRAFHTKLLLQKHINSDHLGIKNHVCNICGKAFGYRNGMTKHQRDVHKREKLNFSRMPTYLQHEQNHNNDNL